MEKETNAYAAAIELIPGTTVDVDIKPSIKAIKQNDSFIVNSQIICQIHFNDIGCTWLNYFKTVISQILGQSLAISYTLSNG